MRTVALSGLALALAAIPGVAFAAHDSGLKAPKLPMAPVAGVSFPTTGVSAPASMPSVPSIPEAAVPMPSVPESSATSSSAAPGSYRAPAPGFQLPAYWTQPQFYIADYQAYGFREPAPGFGWSRYYDDAVITDGNGRVYDSISGVNWNNPGRGYDQPAAGKKHKRHGGLTGLAGGLIGGTIGALAGNLIAGHGDKLAGSLIGGGVGAIAGLAVESAMSKRNHNQQDNGRYGDGRYDDRPHWGRGGGYDYGYQGGGYNYGCCQQPTVITMQSEPVTTTSTRTYYETVRVRVPVRHRVWHRPPVRHHYRPRQQCIVGS
jgi:Nickel/cobalt transporter regulator